MRAQRMDVPVRLGLFELLYKAQGTSTTSLLSVASAAALPIR
jgi:hypothetical protein